MNERATETANANRDDLSLKTIQSIQWDMKTKEEQKIKPLKPTDGAK